MSTLLRIATMKIRIEGVVRNVGELFEVIVGH